MPPRRSPRHRANHSLRCEPANAQLESAERPKDSSHDESQNLCEAVATLEHDDGAGMHDHVHEDDICPICHLLLHAPVVTRCNHTLCRSCMATWADVSLSQPMTIVPVDEQATDFDPVSGLEARCPMCRTQTSAVADVAREQALLAKYSDAYAKREDEEREDAALSESIQTITVCVGNHHSLVEPQEEGSSNTHEWTFFVRPSRTDVIEEVQIFLHHTFRQNRIIRQRAPYEVRRVGWGFFSIVACIILKAGYSWMSGDAEDAPDGAPKGMLRFEWLLDFQSFGGKGAMGRWRLKVKNDRDWEDIVDENERDDAEWDRFVRQYQQDGNYVPPAEE